MSPIIGISTNMHLFVGWVFPIFIIYLFGCFILKYIRWATSPLFKLPSATTRRGLKEFLFGSVVEIRREPFMAPQNRWWKKAGLETPMIHFSMLLGRHVFLILDAEIVKGILTETSKVRLFKKHYPQVENIMGNSLVTTNGEDWKRLRRICQPAFLVSYLKRRIGESVRAKNSKLMQYWIRAKGRKVDLGSHFSALTLDVFGDVGFSYDFNALGFVDKWSKNNQSDNSTHTVIIMEKLFNALSVSMKRNSLARMLLLALGLSKLEKYLIPGTKKINQVIDEIIDDVILNARKHMDDSTQSAEDIDYLKTRSLLQLIISAENQDTGENKSTSSYLTHNELRETIKTFLIAGHETTATMCTLATFCLSLYPDIQEKVYQDIVKHSSSGVVELNEIESMSYFLAFLKEVMRLYPPIPLIYRHTTRSDKVGGVKMPKDTRICIPMYLLHRHPSYWGDDALEFRPERWIEHKHPASHPFAYIPFSDGERLCIGKRFADIEFRLILANLFRKFHFQLAPETRNQTIDFQIFVALAPKQNLLAFVTERNPLEDSRNHLG